MTIKYYGNIDLTPFEQLAELKAKLDKTAVYIYPRPKKMDTIEEVTEVMRKVRESQNMTREQLASKAGVDVKVVEDLETKGYTRYALAKHVFKVLRIKPLALPIEFAREDLKAAQSKDQ